MKKILIADHIEAYRSTLKRALEVHGLPTCDASTPEELFSYNFNDIMLLLIADNFSDVSAFDILDKAKKTPELSDIPFIICSTHDDPDYIAKCIKSGFKDLLLRPYNRKIAFRKIKHFLLESKMIDPELFKDDSETTKIQEEEKIEFLQMVVDMAPEEIMPVYNSAVNTGYSYPAVNDFFGITPGEGYSILREFYKDKALARTLIDKVSLCPTCNYHTINFREVCPKCKSLDINIESIYHHFSCGYIGPATDFNSANSDMMKCPKCDKFLRHIGLDYEKPSDTFICKDCNFICSEPAVEFKCFYCGIVAPAEDTVVSNVYSYHATPKTSKIIEYGSFTAFDIKEVLENDNKGHFSRDFFDYMLKLKYHEHLEFGDPLIAAILSTGSSKKVLEEASEYISAMSGHTTLAYKENETTLFLIISRKNLELVKQNAENLLTMITASGVEEECSCRLMLREFKHQEHKIESFIESTYQIFLEQQENITDGVMVYGH